MVDFNKTHTFSLLIIYILTFASEDKGVFWREITVVTRGMVSFQLAITPFKRWQFWKKL